jgi:2-aminoadipate transaminase
MNTPKYSQYFVSNANEMVNFGVGQPETDKLPLDFFKSALINIGTSLDNSDKEVLQYSQIKGYESFRENLANWLNENNYSIYNKVTKDELFITQGATGALQLLMTRFINQGDIVLVEEPSYFLAIKMFKEYGCTVKGVKMNNNGIDLVDLENKINYVLDQGQQDVYLYSIPTCHNPTSITLSDDMRIALSNIADKYSNFSIIADETYHFLEWSDKKFSPMADYHGNFISIGSFSKIIAPSLRVGWIYQNNKLSELSEIEILSNQSSLDSSGGNSVLGSLIIEYAIITNYLNQILKENREKLKNRCDVLSLKLKELDFDFVHPTGGYFIWLKLGEEKQYDYTKLLEYNINNNNRVRYHNGDKFSNNDNFKNYARLSFSFYNEEDLIIGAHRLRSNLDNFNKTKIGILGYKGRLGSKIYNNLMNNQNYLVFGLDRDYKNNLNSLNNLNMIIDVSSPTGTFELIDYLNKINNLKIKLLIGTTGHNNKTLKLIKNYSKDKKVGVHLISNFSEGIPLFKKFIENIENKNKWKFKMVEYHHIHKQDKPSGTAKMLVSNITSNIDEIEIESVREGEIFGEHRLIFETEDELMEIIHKAKNRDIFANGAIKMIDKLLKSNDFYTDYDLSNLNDIEFKIFNASGNILMVIEGEIENKLREDLVLKFKDLYPKIDGYLFINEYNFNQNNQDNDNLNCVWEYYNKDGNKVNFCGNGLRTITYYHLKNIPNKRMVFNNLEGFYHNNLVKSQMPQPIKLNLNLDFVSGLRKLVNEDLELNISIRNIVAYKTGVPHLIIDINENIYNIDDNTFEFVSQIIYNYYQDNYNKEGINVNFVNVLKDNTLNVRTFERGVFKETGSCGSGCTSSLYYYLDKIVGFNDSVTVKFNVKSQEKLYGYYNNNTFYLEGNVSEIKYEQL